MIIDKINLYLIKLMNKVMIVAIFQIIKINKLLKMSAKKPNLTIQIEQLGQQFNSKFQGYVDYPIENQQDVRPSAASRNDIHGSRASNRSNQSNVSERSALFQRAQHLMMEDRMEENLRKISARSKMKGLNNSKSHSKRNNGTQTRDGARSIKKQQFVQRQFTRSKSASEISLSNSRAKVLQQIADKLKKIDRIKKQDYDSAVNSQVVSRVHSEEGQHNRSRVEKIKQIKQEMIKHRGGKLQHLLKDIKKSNKQAYKVVYTIKKSSKTGSPFQKSLQMRDKIHEQAKKPAATITTNLFDARLDKSESLKKLAQQLQGVRQQLREVKVKNDQLLQLSQQRSANNSYIVYQPDSGSQSSRITGQIQALQFDAMSNSSAKMHQYQSSQLNSLASGSGSNLYPPFTKDINSRNHTNYQIIQPTNFIQPCFACGCTCRSRNFNKNL